MLQDFGPYSIVRKLAVGGMAEIYLARERGLEGLVRSVVIKRILPTYSDNPEFVTMFLDEARLMAALSHPHIAAVYSVGKDDESFYITMEHVRGPTLAALLSAARRAGRRGLPRRSALGIILQIAEALSYVHRRRDEIGRPLNIIHRDLNPANVMVSYDGAVKLIDFGIAKAATKVYETRTGVIKGTYGYMAPEQLGKRKELDHRADIFALGVMMYEVCLGVHPFDASNEANIIDRLLKAAYRRPREIDPGFPKDLDRLVTSCMAVHPDARPPDMRAVVESIVTHLEKHRQVPTMRKVSELVHSLLPDTESPAPLEPMSAQRMERAFNEDSERNATQKKRAHDTHETAAPIHDKREHTVPIRAVPLHPEDDGPTVIANRPPIEALTVPVVGERALDVSEEMTAAAHLPPERARQSREPTEVGQRRKRKSSGPLRQIMLFVGSATLVLGVGIAAFVTARAVSGTGAVAVEAPDASPSEPDAGAAEQAPRLLRITSEPAGASIFIDGEESNLVTPATLPVPSGRDRVVVRTALEGFVTRERSIFATAGEARFVLDALEAPDAGPADAAADADTAMAAPPAMVRPRMWRRRGMRRR